MEPLHAAFSLFSFLAMTGFVLFSWPDTWRKNRRFFWLLLLCQVIGLTALGIVFLGFFPRLEGEGLRQAVSVIAVYAYMLTLFLTIFFAARWVIVRLCRRFGKGAERKSTGPTARRLEDRRFHAALFLILSLTLCTAGFCNAGILRDTGYEVTVSKPCGEKELTVVFFSDLHAGAGNWPSIYPELAEHIDAAHGDVLLIGGDVFDETTAEIDVDYVGRMLDSIQRPRYGIYFVYGNHDDDTEDWAAEQLRAHGVTVLKDEMAVLDGDIQLIGRMDPRYGALPLEELLEKVRPDRSRPILMLTHRPEKFREMAALGCDLALAGHTHGFNIPFFLGSPMLEDMYYGIGDYDGMKAVTSSGVSAWGFHYKWPAKSEVVTIHLTFSEQGSAGAHP